MSDYFSDCPDVACDQDSATRFPRCAFECEVLAETIKPHARLALHEAALDTIAHGLCMYGSNGRLILCNDQYLRMYGLDPAVIRPGCTLREDIEHRKETGSFTGDPEQYCAEIVAGNAEGIASVRFLETADGRAIHVVHRPMAGGGWVTTHEDVTETRQAEDALRHSKHVLENTFEHMDQGISIVDVNLTMLATNRRFRELLNFPEWLCRPNANFADFIRFNAERGEYGPGDIEQQVRSRVELARRFEPHVFERERPDGTIIEIRGTPLPGGGFVTIYTDVTKRVRAEREARAAHERLRDAFEVVPEGLALFDAEDRYVLWNRKYAELYGESTADIRAGTCFEDVLRAGLAKGQYVEARGREDAWLAERLALHAESESAHEQRLPGDRCVRVQERRTADGGSVGIRVDITELKRREDSFKLLFESNPVPMFVFDIEDLKFIAVNDAALDHYGYTRDQFMAMTALDIRPPEDRERFASIVATFGNERRAVSSRHLKSDGSVIEVDIYSRALNYRGRPARFVSAIDVTERRRAEEERNRSREFLNQIIDNVPVSITVKDAKERRFIMMNRAAEEHWSLSRSEAIGKTVRDLFGNERAEWVAARDNAALRADGPVDLGEHRNVERGDESRVFASMRVAVRDKDGTPLYLVGVTQDITELKRREDSFKLLFESNPVPMFVFDVETLRFLAVNEAAIQHYGYSREQFMTMTGPDIGPPEDRERLAAKIQSVHGGVRAARWRHQKADGALIDVEVYSTAIIYQGASARFVSAIDVTKRLRAEQERDRSREFLYQIIDNVPVSITVKEAKELRFIMMNRAAEEYWGVSRSKAFGKTVGDLFGKERAEWVAARDNAALRAGGPVDLGEHRKVGRGDESRIFSASRVAVRDKDGTPLYVVGVMQDITERKAIEGQLQQAQKMEAVGNLTGGLAHDFNNLLTIIIGNLDLLQGDIAGNSAAEQRVETILQASERGADLTRQLLAFSRRQPLQPKLVEINALVGSTMKLMARTLGETITVELRTAADLWHVRVDEAQLESALVNIAINARDAMPDGGRLLIETRNAHLDADYAAHHAEVTAGDYAIIEISDTGTGMPPEVLARIFDPFFTTKGQGKGTGLGLSMVYGFVKQSGGHISAYSEVGEGATFKLYLPRAPAQSDLPRAHGGPDEPAAAVDAVVLAVDDNPDVRAAVVAQLCELGYRVMEADCAAAALKVLDGGAKVDLLFTDIMMPGGVTGKELAATACARHPHLKVLFTSGFPGAFLDKDVELNVGGALLSKPYRQHDLAKAVRDVLHQG